MNLSNFIVFAFSTKRKESFQQRTIGRPTANHSESDELELLEFPEDDLFEDGELELLEELLEGLFGFEARELKLLEGWFGCVGFVFAACGRLAAGATLDGAPCLFFPFLVKAEAWLAAANKDKGGNCINPAALICSVFGRNFWCEERFGSLTASTKKALSSLILTSLSCGVAHSLCRLHCVLGLSRFMCSQFVKGHLTANPPKAFFLAFGHR